MRIVWLTALLLGGAALGLVLSTGEGVSSAQVSPAPKVAPPQRDQPTALLSLTLRGAQRSLTDTVKGVLIEHDPPKNWALLITGAKGKGQFTCEVRSTDRQALFDLQRAILFSKAVSVNCANGTPSSRGGVLIDLDDPKGGALVVGAER